MTTLVALAVMTGCELPNPDYDAIGQGEDSEATSGSEDPSTTEDPETGDGDGDGEPGDGDGEPGDGDGEPGDGDGEPVPECYSQNYHPSADTFFQSGPNGQGGCIFNWSDALGPAAIGCQDLNFGTTPWHWIGVDSGGPFGQGKSYYAFTPPEVDLPPDYEIVAVTIVVSLSLLEPQPGGAYLELRTIANGEQHSWHEGPYDGELATSGEHASTYAYRVPEDASWPDFAFSAALDELVAEVSLANMFGPAMPVPIDIEPAFVEDYSLNPDKYANGFALTTIGTAGFDVLLESLEGEANYQPYFTIEACPL